jgi:hypothetical protein
MYQASQGHIRENGLYFVEGIHFWQINLYSIVKMAGN